MWLELGYLMLVRYLIFLLRYKKSHVVTIEVIEKILIFKYFNIRVGGIIIFSDVSYHNFIQLSLSM